MKQKVYLIRGLPGSGKSTLARNLAAAAPTYHVEADQYFEVRNMPFDGKYLGLAHEECYSRFLEALEEGIYDVIVSNTFTQLWEMENYLTACKLYNIKPCIIECKSNFGSIHNVPAATIERMKSRWEVYNEAP